MLIKKDGYTTFDEKCFCCKNLKKCKLIDGKLVCEPCNHIDDECDIR